MSAVVIRCPLPRGLSTKLQIDKVRLEINVPSSLLPDGKGSTAANSTDPFKVCGLQEYQEKISRVRDNHTVSGSRRPDGVAIEKKKHDLLVCSATSRRERPHLVEWLEHHLTMGVTHFVLYDTTLPSPTTAPTPSLADTLQDYISRGVVSVVRWPYENCVRGMATGRHVALFKAPGTIAHNAALASCFSRQKDRSRWIAHIDDDEFLVSCTKQLLSAYVSLF
jgi:hypothetical protein